MTAIRNRNGKWQVQVRIKGRAARTKSLTSTRDAEGWARQPESELEASGILRGRGDQPVFRQFFHQDHLAWR